MTEPLADLERHLLGAARHLTRAQVAERAGVPLDVAEELWGQLGFPHTSDDDVAFTEADVEALRTTVELIDLGVVDPDSQAALVRAWGHSFARLAEWQTGLLAGIAMADDDPEARLQELLGDVLPRVGRLQDYVWRRHLENAAQRLLPTVEQPSEQVPQSVVFVDIVDYTRRSKSLTEAELVELVELFEDEVTRAVVTAGGRVIKTIGDEVLFVVDDVRAATEVALTLAERGDDEDDAFPRVRVGLAHGAVTSRLGDVFGPTVNIAARLTSVARPGTVLVDRGAVDVLTGRQPADAGDAAEDRAQGPQADPAPDDTPLTRLIDRAADELADLSPFAESDELRFRRLRRVSVKGYRHLEPWVVRRRRPRPADAD